MQQQTETTVLYYPTAILARQGIVVTLFGRKISLLLY